ncbi:unknown protein [Seminavis robusta]|uniref:PiggyBac transposable element-derived protein domain-containing protein n=1 Tax=Seminavis robusta TaxID=568900 RepID=A0A9N8HH31_9STRA|nr:unknown protein [Seminavis robusta]|eukprot:Sro540_g162980.1 n/a (978) ;mRNA; f:27317-30250
MTDPPMPPLHGQTGPQGEETLPSIVRETVDLSQFITGGAAHASLPIEEGSNSDEEIPQETRTQQTQDTVITTASVTAKKKKRQTFKYANRVFKCNSELFLDPNYKNSYLQRYPQNDLELVGKVTQCPSIKNGRKYGFKWIISGTLMDVRWTQSFVEFTPAFRLKLKGLILAYEKEQEELSADLEGTPADQSPGESQATANVPTGRSSRTPTNETPANETTQGSSGPTDEERAQAYASLKTACSTGDGTTTIRGRKRGSRRITRGDDVDGYESESEDGEDLDQHDDSFYFAMREEGYDTDADDIYEIQATDGTTIAKENTYGKLAQKLQWKFQPVEPGDVPFTEKKNMREGKDAKTQLKSGVGDRWKDPFECFQRLGCNREFVTALTRESNDYAKNQLLDKDRKKKLCGGKWKDITVKETYVFLGILLKISLSPVDGGGYPAYFQKECKSINYCNHNEAKPIKNSQGWAQDYMSLTRFKQIRAAFHPEDKDMAAGSSDKCYQLRRAINAANAASKATFEAGSHCAFDEGGVACRSRFCPVRQYNKDKPNKFRVDFFILACSTTYAILHLDVYQGRNSKNIGIDESIHDLATTQKAVMNAVMSTFGDGQGARHIAMDNRYMCPELAVLLLTKCGCYSTGTCRRRRKGFPSDLLDLDKKDARGEYKIVADKVNRLLMMQWVDSKVVTMVSSMNDTTVGTVKRQVGPLARQLDCPRAMIRYQKTMFGVDKGDEIRAHFGGFSTKAHFKKWYKRVFLAILDIMMMNARIAWNLSAQEKASRNRNELKRHDFMLFIAECLLEYNEPEEDTSPAGNSAIDPMKDHIPLKPKKAATRNRCIVCRLENGKWFDPKLGESGTRSGVCVCSVCGVYAHNHVVEDSNRHIHKLQQFENMTCFQIAHHPDGLELWPMRDINHPKGARGNNRSGPVWKSLRKLHGKDERETRKRKRQNDGEEEEETTEDENGKAEETGGTLYDSSDNELYG